MMLSTKQQAMFWVLWGKVEREEFPSASPFERDAARRAIMFRACGRVSLKGVNQSKEFDRLMAAVAAITGDYRAMSYWSIAAERRTAHMIHECARQIGEIVGESKGWEYCQAVFEQARLPASWIDIPDALLMSTFQMLDTHRRRLLKREGGWLGARVGQPLGFCADRHYVRRGLAISFYDGAHPASAPSPHFYAHAHA